MRVTSLEQLAARDRRVLEAVARAGGVGGHRLSLDQVQAAASELAPEAVAAALKVLTAWPDRLVTDFAPDHAASLGCVYSLTARGQRLLTEGAI